MWWHCHWRLPIAARGRQFHKQFYLNYGGTPQFIFAHQNYLGSDSARTNITGGIDEACQWNPYGEFVSQCSYQPSWWVISPIGFAGYERDVETGLDHMQFRYYNSRIGRFMSADPYDGSVGPPSFGAFGDGDIVNIAPGPLGQTILQELLGIQLPDPQCDFGPCTGNDPMGDSFRPKAGNNDPCDALCQAVFHSPQAQNAWHQADCTINGTLKGEAGDLAGTSETATATGAITAAESAGTKVTTGVLKELGKSFSELAGIIEYWKVTLRMYYNMFAGCQ